MSTIVNISFTEKDKLNRMLASINYETINGERLGSIKYVLDNIYRCNQEIKRILKDIGLDIN